MNNIISNIQSKPPHKKRKIALFMCVFVALILLGVMVLKNFVNNPIESTGENKKKIKQLINSITNSFNSY